jgi:hypothetical protein
MTGISRLKKIEQRLKLAKTAPSAVKVAASVFWESQSVLFIDFLIEQRTIKADY